MPLSSIPELIDDIRAGNMVILMDDEDRENEGDLIIAAEKVTPAAINFFATEACGLICMPITEERARQLRLPLMVRDNRSQHETNFTVSIDATEQVAAGISAAQRAHTIKQASKKNAGPADIRQPGHIFPLVAKPGGVLKRAGHTEAGVDLARMAGLEPAAVIVEIMNHDGTMARRPELEVFAEEHGLRMGTIADLIEYRSLHEHSVEVVSHHEINTEWGPFSLHTFSDHIDDTVHFALSRGEIQGDQPIPVRVQPINTLRDVLGTRLSDGSAGWSYRSAMSHIAAIDRGVVVLVGNRESREELLSDIALFSGDAPKRESPQNYRLIGTGAQILRHLGVRRMQILSAPVRFNALSGFNLEITEFISEPLS
ncbi:riboflavin biosynthesis protein ribAB [Luminiphilus syltensis NOR5-1B]|uniref:3,4-dihydroxy-2-butanone 4-phosphate synthase n=1 Tax=Luminiphilus syltensis NOR5-1B TaxID=565045 RepID=B8KXS7_9GAMM|nr:3,4-dihydroxy-2-butanone-4-phosphate synthase [Luminiphilus syltensis]EED35562.1 riboflavin biosynthesis protein ribAB [Luminiphilus syltensis NOR5-1B]